MEKVTFEGRFTATYESRRYWFGILGIGAAL